jgi:hypothetical protein
MVKVICNKLTALPVTAATIAIGLLVFSSAASAVQTRDAEMDLARMLGELGDR